MKEKFILHNTSNKNFAYLIGTKGTLHETNDRKFHFCFEGNGRQDLSSTIQRKMGYELEDPRCNEIVYITSNSEYVFRNLDYKDESCYNWAKR